MRKKLAKPSAFLTTLDAHTIYDADELAMDYAKEVGEPPPKWPRHSLRRCGLDMRKRGLGGWLSATKPPRVVAYGYEVAEWLATEITGTRGPGLHGLGSRFRDAVKRLREAGK